MMEGLSFMPEGWRVPRLWMRRISCRLRLSLLPEIGQRARIFISETQWLPGCPRALCPISGSNDSRKRQEMRLIHSLGTLHPSGINERLSFI